VHWSLYNLYLLLPGFALVLFRVAGLLVTAPIFGSSAVPARLKVAFAFGVAACVFPLVAPTLPEQIALSGVLVGVLGEMLIGLVIGLAVTVMVTGVQLAGMLIGQQAGIALASAIDPTSNASTTVVGQIYVIVATLIFLVIGGHRLLVRALLDTFAVVPAMGFRMTEPTLLALGDLLSAAYVLGVRLFSPVLIALLVASLVMAFLSRTMPQLNILTVGFPVRAMTAMGMSALALSVSQNLLVESLLDVLAGMREMLGLTPLVL